MLINLIYSIFNFRFSCLFFDRTFSCLFYFMFCTSNVVVAHINENRTSWLVFTIGFIFMVIILQTFKFCCKILVSLLILFTRFSPHYTNDLRKKYTIFYFLYKTLV